MPPAPSRATTSYLPSLRPSQNDRSRVSWHVECSPELSLAAVSPPGTNVSCGSAGRSEEWFPESGSPADFPEAMGTINPALESVLSAEQNGRAGRTSSAAPRSSQVYVAAATCPAGRPLAPELPD